MNNYDDLLLEESGSGRGYKEPEPLTEEEMAQFDKTIKGFTLDKNGLFSIEYDDETEACS